MIDTDLRDLELRVRSCPDDIAVCVRYAHSLGLAGRVEDSREEYHRLLRNISPEHEFYETARDGYVTSVCATATRSFRGFLNRPDALREALRREVRLQSLVEAVAARLGNIENSQEYQVMSTLALYYRDREKGVVAAFAEVPTTKEGIAFAQEGYEIRYESDGFRDFIVSARHNVVAELLLARAQQEGRVVKVPEGRDLTLSTVSEGCVSAYSQHPFVQALFGSSAFAEMNAECLRARNHTQGKVWYISRTYIEERIAADRVLVQPAGFDVSIYGINSYLDFDGIGSARGVVHVGKKKSIRNEY